MVGAMFFITVHTYRCLPTSPGASASAGTSGLCRGVSIDAVAGITRWPS